MLDAEGNCMSDAPRQYCGELMIPTHIRYKAVFNADAVEVENTVYAFNRLTVLYGFAVGYAEAGFAGRVAVILYTSYRAVIRNIYSVIRTLNRHAYARIAVVDILFVFDVKETS